MVSVAGRRDGLIDHRPAVIGGVLSELDTLHGATWERIAYLVSGFGPPTGLPPRLTAAVPALGLTGPVSVLVPKVTPGTYRISRSYSIVSPRVQKYRTSILCATVTVVGAA